MSKNISVWLVASIVGLFAINCFAISPGAGQAQIRNNMQQMKQDQQRVKQMKQKQQQQQQAPKQNLQNRKNSSQSTQ